jgi:ribonuclease HII
METQYFDINEIGLDEAGRGPLIGRVYAGAVIWDPTKKNDIITDSKKLSEKKRKIALKWIKENVSAWGVGFAEASEIDSINILEATKLAMERAISNIKTNFPKYKDTNNLIIDGCYWEKKFPEYNVKSIVKGDSKYLSIASASIIAKEYHDEHIHQLCLDNNDLNIKYDLENNMGYGTKKHLLGLETYGPSMFHRKTFKRCEEKEI